MLRHTATIYCDGIGCQQRVIFDNRDYAEIVRALKTMGWIPGSFFHAEQRKRKKHYCCQACYDSYDEYLVKAGRIPPRHENTLQDSV